MAFRCIGRHFCPSCHAHRLAEWSLWLEEHLLAPVPHRQMVLTLPKRLRAYFLHDRRRLGLLSRVVTRTLCAYVQAATGEHHAVPGVIACVQTFGSLANLHPHLHVRMTDGAFRPDGGCRVARDSARAPVAESRLRYDAARAEVELVSDRNEGPPRRRAPVLRVCPSATRRGYVTAAPTPPAAGCGGEDAGSCWRERAASRPPPRSARTPGPRCGRAGGAGPSSCAAGSRLRSICPSCGGAARILGFVTEPAVAARILAHLARRGTEARAGPWAGAAAAPG